MSEIRVNTVISSAEPGRKVHFENGLSGIGSHLSLAPEITNFSPEGNAFEVPLNTNIVFTFDQNIQFSSVPGDIELRIDSADGELIESFTTGSSSNLSISNNVLTINPTDDLYSNNAYYIIIPTPAISNSFGVPFKGINKYKFTTTRTGFVVIGGTHTFTRSDPQSPTGSFKYHVFTGTGPLVLNSPGGTSPSSAMLLVGGGGGGGSYPSNYYGGGGGGGGGFVKENSISKLSRGSYTVTIGSGGLGQRPSSSSYGRSGGDSIVATPTGTQILNAKGGGGGYYEEPYSPEGQRKGGSGGGRNAGQPSPQQPQAKFGSPGYLGQGNRGMGNNSGSPQPYHYIVGGGGGGAAIEGGASASFSAPGTPYGSGSRGGFGGSGSPAPEFRSPEIGPSSPTIPPSSRSKIGSQGLYGGGGGGGAGGPWPSYPTPAFTAGAGGPGGGGHGSRVNPSYSPFGGSLMTPTSPEPAFQGPDNYAQPGYQHTGGGGGGSCGPYGTYYAGSGGSGIFIIRYSV